MEIQGKIIAVLPERSGTSAKGDFVVASYVIEEINVQYPKKVCFEVFGSDRISQFAIRDGEECKVYFDIDAHRWQDRWFNSVRAWKVEHISNAQSVSPVQPTEAFPAAPAAPAQGASDDLPF